MERLLKEVVLVNEQVIERMRRHLGFDTKIELTSADGNVDSFEIKSLGVKHIPRILYVISQMSDAAKKSPENPFLTLSDKGMETLCTLVEETIKRSPEFKDMAQEDIDSFIHTNFIILSAKVLEINSLSGGMKSADNEALMRAKEIQKLREKNESVESNGG